jgi:hypothetical protein
LTYADAGSPQCVTSLVGCHGSVLDLGAFIPIDFPGATRAQREVPSVQDTSASSLA